MAYPAQKYQTTPEPGNPARTEAWALLESARDLPLLLVSDRAPGP